MMKILLKWIGIVVGSLIGLLAVAFVVLILIGGARANQKHDIPVETMPIPSDAVAIQHGEHVAITHYCTKCHTSNLGGEVFYTIPNLLTIPTPNLTSGAGGVGSFYSDEDWVRAIQHGVGHDGRALWIMPAEGYAHLSDEDIGALIAYLKSVPPVDNTLPERRFEPMGQVMLALGMVPPVAVDRIDHTAPRVAAVKLGVNTEYGGYIAITTCTACHGVDLNGAPFGPPGEEVPTPNLTPGGELAVWSEEEFITTMRTGVTPGGYVLNADEMPWPFFGQMTDDELKALWRYLHSLPARPQGG